jgi:hypothetical protein
MRKVRFDRLVASLDEVREHVTSGKFRRRVKEVDILQKWERGERRPSGAARSLLLVMRADIRAVVQALSVASSKRQRRVRKQLGCMTTSGG